MATTKNISKYKNAEAQKKTLADVIEGFMADVLERFPHLKGRLLIADVNQRRSYGAEYLDHEAVSLTIDEIPGYLGKKHDPAIGSCASYDSARSLGVIFIDEHIDEAEFNDISGETEKHILYVLNHELGHLILENGRYTKNSSLHIKVIAESAADAYAYALMCHYQHYGVNSACADKTASSINRLTSSIVDDMTHFTTFVLNELIKRRDLIDFEALTPRQTADLAGLFATKYAPSAPVIEKLYKVFEPVREASKTNWEEAIKKMVDITLDPTADYYTFSVGGQWLRHYLDGHFKWPNGRDPKFSEEYLSNVSTELKEREFKFAAEDILFNVPTVSEKPTPARQRRPQPQTA